MYIFIEGDGDVKTNKEVFWTVLPKYMDTVHMKQIDLAKAVGVSKSTVHCWLARKSFPEMDTIQKIADALNCRTDDLLMEIPEAFSPAVEDLEIRRLWPTASIQAKRTALAVLKSFYKEDTNK